MSCSPAALLLCFWLNKLLVFTDRTDILKKNKIKKSSPSHQPIRRWRSTGEPPLQWPELLNFNYWEWPCGEKKKQQKHFSPADTALTHPLFLLLTASVTLLPPLAALPVFSVDFNQNPLPVFWKCQGVAVVRMSRWLLRIQYIKRVFTALQLGSAFTVSSSAVCLGKGRNGKLPRVCRQFWHSAYSLNSLAVHSILPFFPC